MGRIGRHGLYAMLAGGVIAATGWAADTQPAATKPAATKPAAAARVPSALEQEANAKYDELANAYMHNQWDQINEGLKYFTQHMEMRGQLSPDKRVLIEYMRGTVAQVRPKWWDQTKSSSNISFRSQIWGQDVMTNYVPSTELGMEIPAQVDLENNRLLIAVSWRPSLVDNPRPQLGSVAQRLKLTKGDLGEAIVWHELGHSFISNHINLTDAIDLYRNYRELYGHLQEYFADLTSIAHCSAEARPVAMIARIDLIDPPPPEKYMELEAHTRGSHAIGTMFLFEVLANRDKWPHIHLPPTIPAQNTELATITYIYENWDTAWSVQEDKQLKEWATNYVKQKGDGIFRSKGRIPLIDGMNFELMEAQDRDNAKKRDAWIKTKLKVAIDAGKADKTAPRRGFVSSNSRLEVPLY